MAVFYDNRWVSVPCPDGKPGCAVNHMVLRADYDKLRQEQKDTSAEWTRQYEKGIEDGEQKMLERIIKLLKEHTPCPDYDGHTFCNHNDCNWEDDWQDHFIALIKGETNE